MVNHTYSCAAFHKRWGHKVIDAKYEEESSSTMQCPECLGKMVNGKCLDCGWTPKFAKTYKKLKELEAETPSPTFEATATYNKATGWLAIDFPSKPNEEVRSELKREGYRWRPRRKQWIAKWTTSREDLAKKMAGKVETVDIERDYSRIAERARELEQKHQVESDRRHKTAHGIMDAIPLGQPILVGHHSEKRHRRDLKRIDTNIRKGIEEGEIAEKYSEKAVRYERLATRGENPITIHNRIKRLEVDKHLPCHRD